MANNIYEIFETGNAVAVIAEIGNNHNGDIQKAFRLIDQAKDIGADFVKFQMRNRNQLYRKKSILKKDEDLGSEYILDLLEKFELTIDEHWQLFKYCKKVKIKYMCTPWDFESLKQLEEFGSEFYKVSSADLTNLPLVKAVAETNKLFMISTGMSDEEEIRKTISKLHAYKDKFAVLHCNSTYPAPFEDINLKWLKRLQDIHPVIGYSGHERGTAVSLAAVGMGARVVERHITLSRSMEGPDHAASLEVEEFNSLVKGVREVELALGTPKKNISQGELINRENLSKSLVASKAIKKGQLILDTDVMVKSPGQGLNPQFLSSLIGKKANRDMTEEDFFYQSDIEDTKIGPSRYKFSLKWGVPVRYHDFNFYAKVNADLLEFHLSYNDMNLNVNDFLFEQKNKDVVVHAPELFKDSKLMDLASLNKDYREESIRETQRVINITERINEFFPNTKRPLLVTNIGGHSLDKKISEKEKLERYELFADSLNKLNLENVELIPQTMAPFPWHFGGQRHQNLFVLPDEIVDWCEKLNLRMCLDVSHSKLTCNYYKLNFIKFIEAVSLKTAHIHMGDARGINGEGLQVGDGEIDFQELGKVLKKNCKGTSFIPEVWQGHKDEGRGFWTALERLEGLI